jgi:Ricin-type beta-trefoil lectin domain
MIRRIMATAIAAASLVLLVSPGAANADEKVAVESADIRGYVWDGQHSGGQIILEEDQGTGTQRWASRDNILIMWHSAGECATEENGTIWARQCWGNTNKVWSRIDLGNEVYLLRNRDTGQCATHNGKAQPLVMRPCDPDRADQHWLDR